MTTENLENIDDLVNALEQQGQAAEARLGTVKKGIASNQKKKRKVRIGARAAEQSIDDDTAALLEEQGQLVNIVGDDGDEDDTTGDDPETPADEGGDDDTPPTPTPTPEPDGDEPEEDEVPWWRRWLSWRSWLPLLLAVLAALAVAGIVDSVFDHPEPELTVFDQNGEEVELTEPGENDEEFTFNVDSPRRSVVVDLIVFGSTVGAFMIVWYLLYRVFNSRRSDDEDDE